MIVSHTQKLIFVKTKKVGGTSFEIALSKFCGPDCVITPISSDDEETRRGMGFVTAQNYENTHWVDHGMRINGKYANHTPAPVIKSAIPPAIWNAYKKVTIYRNPYDAAISRYYYEGGERTGLNFGAFVDRYRKLLLENLTIAPLHGEAQLDHYLRYEHLSDDLEAAGLGYLVDTFTSLRAKGNRRPQTGASMAELYAAYPAAADIVRTVCAEEIEHFGYDLR